MSCVMENSFLSFEYSLKVLLLTYLAPKKLIGPKSFPESQALCKPHETLVELTHSLGTWGRGRTATANHQECFPMSPGKLQSSIPGLNSMVLLTQELKPRTQSQKTSVSFSMTLSLD